MDASQPDASHDREIDFELSLEEDVDAELEEFSLLWVLGVYDEARELAETLLWRHLKHFNVLSKIADFVVSSDDAELQRRFRNTIYSKAITFNSADEQAFVTTIVAILDYRVPIRPSEILAFDQFQSAILCHKLKIQIDHAIIRGRFGTLIDDQNDYHESLRVTIHRFLQCGMLENATTCFTTLIAYAWKTSWRPDRFKIHMEIVILFTTLQRDLGTKMYLSTESEREQMRSLEFAANASYLKLLMHRRYGSLANCTHLLESTIQHSKTLIDTVFDALPDSTPRGSKFELYEKARTSPKMFERETSNVDVYSLPALNLKHTPLVRNSEKCTSSASSTSFATIPLIPLESKGSESANWPSSRLTALESTDQESGQRRDQATTSPRFHRKRSKRKKRSTAAAAPECHSPEIGTRMVRQSPAASQVVGRNSHEEHVSAASAIGDLPITVAFKPSSGFETIISVPKSVTVADLKYILAQFAMVNVFEPPEKLLHDGKLLNDDELLEAYQSIAEGIIHLTAGDDINDRQNEPIFLSESNSHNFTEVITHTRGRTASDGVGRVNLGTATRELGIMEAGALEGDKAEHKSRAFVEEDDLGLDLGEEVDDSTVQYTHLSEAPVIPERASNSVAMGPTFETPVAPDRETEASNMPRVSADLEVELRELGREFEEGDITKQIYQKRWSYILSKYRPLATALPAPDMSTIPPTSAMSCKGRQRRPSSDESTCSSRHRSRSRSLSGELLTQALKAAVLAGAGTAFAARNEGDDWQGDKGKRVLTAALTASGVNGLINQYHDPERHKLRGPIATAVPGLPSDRRDDGPASRGASPDGRRRSRSLSRSRGREGTAGDTVQHDGRDERRRSTSPRSAHEEDSADALPPTLYIAGDTKSPTSMPDPEDTITGTSGTIIVNQGSLLKAYRGSSAVQTPAKPLHPHGDGDPRLVAHGPKHSTPVEALPNECIQPMSSLLAGFMAQKTLYDCVAYYKTHPELSSEDLTSIQAATEEAYRQGHRDDTIKYIDRLIMLQDAKAGLRGPVSWMENLSKVQTQQLVHRGRCDKILKALENQFAGDRMAATAQSQPLSGEARPLSLERPSLSRRAKRKACSSITPETMVECIPPDETKGNEIISKRAKVVDASSQSSILNSDSYLQDVSNGNFGSVRISCWLTPETFKGGRRWGKLGRTNVAIVPFKTVARLASDNVKLNTFEVELWLSETNVEGQMPTSYPQPCQGTKCLSHSSICLVNHPAPANMAHGEATVMDNSSDSARPKPWRFRSEEVQNCDGRARAARWTWHSNGHDPMFLHGGIALQHQSTPFALACRVRGKAFVEVRPNVRLRLTLGKEKTKPTWWTLVPQDSDADLSDSVQQLEQEIHCLNLSSSRSNSASSSQGAGGSQGRNYEVGVVNGGNVIFGDVSVNYGVSSSVPFPAVHENDYQVAAAEMSSIMGRIMPQPVVQ